MPVLSDQGASISRGRSVSSTRGPLRFCLAVAVAEVYGAWRKAMHEVCVSGRLSAAILALAPLLTSCGHYYSCPYSVSEVRPDGTTVHSGWTRKQQHVALDLGGKTLTVVKPGERRKIYPIEAMNSEKILFGEDDCYYSGGCGAGPARSMTGEFDLHDKVIEQHVVSSRAGVRLSDAYFKGVCFSIPKREFGFAQDHAGISR